MIDMKIKDEELEAYGSRLLSVGEGINNRIIRLREILNNVCENGAKSGAFHDNLLLFVDLLKSIEGNLTTATMAIDMDLKFYLKEIDDMDGNIY